MRRKKRQSLLEHPPKSWTKNFFGRSWWTGIGSLSTVVGLFISVMIYRQAERIHKRTTEISIQMNRQAEIQYKRDNILRYLNWDWHDRAVSESNVLNDSLRKWGMEADSTCYLYFMDLYEDMVRMGLEDAARVAWDYLGKLK